MPRKRSSSRRRNNTAQVVRQRVEEYIDPTRWMRLTMTDNYLHGIALGTKGHYEVRAPRMADLSASCTCPSDWYPCKHVNALAELWSQCPDAFLDARELLRGLKRRSKEELLTIIERMVEEAPDALTALDASWPEEEEEDEEY